MDSILIRGGRPLRGEVRIHGGKNAVLPILAATAAIRGRFVLHNCPPIRDVEITLRLLEGLGVTSRRQDETLRLDSTGLCASATDPALAGRLRSSILFLGALLTSAGAAGVPLPGGCVLGARPIDLHLEPLRAMGVEITGENGLLCCRGRPAGGTVLLPYPSVGATENLLLAALGAAGPVRIVGAAREPEIADLVRFLRACGADAEGEGTNCVLLRPSPLHGCEYTVLPDRMEAATYLCAAAAAGGEICLRGARPEHLTPVLETLSDAGCSVRIAGDRLTLRAGSLHAAPPVVTGPYPAFPTDAQAPVMAALLRAEGTTVIEETVFEDRFRHVPALRRLGARIDLAGRLAAVRGVERLHGAEMEATDLRGGAAMVVAALSAEGESRITRPEHLFRGYAGMIPALRGLGADATLLRDPPVREDGP